MDLVPVGKQVKYNERWHHRKRLPRDFFKRWEEEERAKRWTVVEHVQPRTEHNPVYEPIYKLEQVLKVDGRSIISTSYSSPWDYEEAQDGEEPRS